MTTGGGMARGRLSQERKQWRKDHPPGFFVKPLPNADGSSNLFKWKGGVPGKAGTDWEGGTYKIIFNFSGEYPSQAPTVYFDPPIFHPNVYSDGKVCLSILTKAWRPAITLKEILVGVQDLLDTPNNNDAAQSEAHHYYKTSKAQYSNRVKAQAKKYATEKL